MKNISIFFLITLSASLASAQQINIIPQPAEMKTENGFLTIKQPIGFIYNDNIPGDHAATFFKDYLKKFYKISNFKTASEHSNGLPTEIFIDYSKNYLPKDGYELTVDKKGIHLAGNESGLFYAFQTLIQLLPVTNSISRIPDSKIQIPFITIKDYPRFSYRGLHLDVGRHFMPVDFIKKYIDYLALHKMNYFHWHLTEDQGWRIEIKKYPMLTDVGAWRNGTIVGRYPGTGNDNIKTGGFYTQEQIKEIVKYAADRYITVVPEIELPGHSSAAIAAYPSLSCFPDEPTKIPDNMISNASAAAKGKLVQETWGVHDDVFCAGKDETFIFLQNVIDEVLNLFPSRYIHVGGDECPKENWKRCPSCQERMKSNNLKDEHELQSYFIQRMEKYLNSKGRTLIGWDEILEGGLAPKAIVMSWRGEEGGIAAAKQNHEVIMTPGSHVYLDHSQSENEDSVTIGGFTTVEKIYSYEPVPVALNEEQAKFVLGAQGNVWTEYLKTPRKVEYMIFPRMSALSEVLWSPKANRNWNDFEKRLPEQFKRYDLWKANYSKAYFDLKASLTPSGNNEGIVWQLDSKIMNAKIEYNTGNNNPSKIYSQPILITKPGIYTAKLYTENKVVSSLSQPIYFNKATGKKITLAKEPSKSYPGDGPFTLVNGVQNEKGRARSKEFLGFNGDDCEAVIDLGSEQTISSVTIHSFRQTGAWIYRPMTTEVFLSPDGNTYSGAGLTDDFNETKNGNGTMTIEIKKIPARFIKVVIKNWGEIAAGNAGAGNKAWLFVDEIAVN